MSKQTSRTPDKPSAPLPPVFMSRGKLVLTICVVLLVYAAIQATHVEAVYDALDLPGNDDAMRLLSVRDWLAGQAWFDMTQHRAVPGDGVSLHWSRFVDAGLGGLVSLFGIWAAPEQAQRLAVVAWPALLFVLFLMATVRFARGYFGWQSASFAAMALVTIVAYGWYFNIGRVDHHNVQMLAMLMIAGLLSDPLLRFRRAGIAGLVAGFSLAVGLESLIFVLLGGGLLVSVFILRGASAGPGVIGYALGLGLSTPIFHIAQTAPSEVLTWHCDKLSPPILLIVGGLAACMILLAALARNLGVRGRVAVAAIIGAGAVVLLVPQMAPCAEGPYGTIPAELRARALSGISEAQPLLATFYRDPGLAFVVGLPAFVTFGFAATILWQNRALVGTSREITSLAVLFVFFAVATVGLVFQLRFAVLVYAVQPLVFGACLSKLWLRGGVVHRGAHVALTLILMASSLLSLPVAGAVRYVQASTSAASGNSVDFGSMDDACATAAALRPLNAVAQGAILSSGNLGTRILLHTHHAAFAFPYHRSTPAIRHAFETYYLPLETFEAAVRDTRATHVLVCAASQYQEDAAVYALAQGNAPGWLQPVEMPDTPVRLFLVLPLGSDGDT